VVFSQGYITDVVIGVLYAPVISDYVLELFGREGSCGGKVVGFFSSSFVHWVVFGGFGSVFGFGDSGDFYDDLDCFSPVYVCDET
jgi:hypothetical protein